VTGEEEASVNYAVDQLIKKNTPMFAALLNLASIVDIGFLAYVLSEGGWVDR
jgi:hypothetical protein